MIVVPLLLRLRWGAVCCFTLLILAVSHFLDIELPLLIVSIIIAFQAFSNLLLGRLAHREDHIARGTPTYVIITIMFLDVALLTLLIHYTGGPMNPFTLLYLVQIVVGSLIMRPRWSWALAIFTMGCYAILFYLPPAVNSAIRTPQPLCHSLPPAGEISPAMQLHLQGMWLAFAITSIFIVLFVSKIQEALEKYQKTINNLKKTKDNNEKLASLATLAAGAAHELSTPLAAIAVAAGEVQHSLRHEYDKPETRQELLDDTIFIRDQIESCKDILYQMSSDAGQPMGEPIFHFNLADCLQEIIKSYNAQITLSEPFPIMVDLPLQTFKRVICSLINNGLDACKNNEEITISYNIKEEGQPSRAKVYIKVKDNGCGMDAETKAHALEPFFTTKEPGKGLGLGLFLAKTVAKRYGGDLEIRSNDSGTTVICSFSLRQP